MVEWIQWNRRSVSPPGHLDGAQVELLEVPGGREVAPEAREGVFSAGWGRGGGQSPGNGRGDRNATLRLGVRVRLMGWAQWWGGCWMRGMGGCEIVQSVPADRVGAVWGQVGVGGSDPTA